MNYFNSLILSLASACILTACDAPPPQSVTSIIWVDGDSGVINEARFRLADVDAPETGPIGRRTGAQCDGEQRTGRIARDYMDRQTQNGVLTYIVLETDRYGRKVIDLFIDGVDLKERALEAGHLRPWRHVSGRPVEPKPDWCQPDHIP